MKNLEEIKRQSRERRKQIALAILEENPDDLTEIRILTRIARTEGNIQEERKYLQQRLELEPNNPKTIMHLIRLARREHRPKEINRLREKMKTMSFGTERQIKGAIHMATLDHDAVSTKLLVRKLNRFLEQEMGMTLEEAEAERKTMQIGQAKKLEKEILRKASGEELEETPIQKARKIIYGNGDIVQDAEKIKELLEGQNETEVAIVLAELYFHTGMQARAEKSLKAYKRGIIGTEQEGDLRIINQALELARSSKTLPYKWEELWEAFEKVVPEFPSAPGDDDER